MIKAVDLRKGRSVVYDGDLFVVHEAQHVAKGNKRSYMQTKLKNLKSGTILDIRFNVDDRLEVPFVESKEYEYLYADGSNYMFMDVNTYDQFPVNGDLIGDSAKFLKENTRVSASVHEGKLISIELPNVVELAIADTPPVVKGATVTNQPKDAVLETGARVRVPAFCEPGNVIRVDTRTGEYIERA